MVTIDTSARSTSTNTNSTRFAPWALQPHHVDACPFVDLPHSKSSRWGGGVTADEMREMQWVKPELVAQIRFVEWTAEGRLRHAAFLGLRADKSAREVRREWPGLSGG